MKSTSTNSHKKNSHQNTKSHTNKKTPKTCNRMQRIISPYPMNESQSYMHNIVSHIERERDTNKAKYDFSLLGVWERD